MHLRGRRVQLSLKQISAEVHSMECGILFIIRTSGVITRIGQVLGRLAHLRMELNPQGIYKWKHGDNRDSVYGRPVIDGMYRHGRRARSHCNILQCDVSELANILGSKPGTIFTMIKDTGCIKPNERKQAVAHLTLSDCEEIRARFVCQNEHSCDSNCAES